MKKIINVISWIIVAAILGFVALVIIGMNHPYMFSGNQQQVEKEWNQPITPTTCYSADCHHNN